MNRNENVKVVFNAAVNSREMVNLLTGLVTEMVDGTRAALPEDYADLFNVEVFTRPSGSRYAVVNFA